MDMKNTFSFPTDIGMLTAVCEDGCLRRLDFKTGNICETDDQVLNDTKTQVEEYLTGKRKEFDLPVKLDGTAFQKKVWLALDKIPYGKTVSYEEIAETIGQPTAQRAVGNAVGRNPLLLIVPCHRVIKKNGETGNFGAGKEIKKLLLNLESPKDNQPLKYTS
jgi:methylated-DNA-[protein]-cysteine S-methyltransferase